MMDRVSWFHKLPYEGPEKLERCSSKLQCQRVEVLVMEQQGHELWYFCRHVESRVVQDYATVFEARLLGSILLFWLV